MTHLVPLPKHKPRLFMSGGLWIAADHFDRSPVSGARFYRPSGKGKTWREAWDDMQAREPVSLWARMARAVGLT